MNEQEKQLNKTIDNMIGQALDKYVDVDSADDFGAYATGFQRGIQWGVENRFFFKGLKIEIDRRCEFTVKKTEEPCQFKDGDFVVIETNHPIVLIYKGERDLDTIFYHCFRSTDGYLFYDNWFYNFRSVIRRANPFEKKSLIADLAREGKRWNPDTLEFENIEGAHV